MRPVVDALGGTGSCEQRILLTGQHQGLETAFDEGDAEMLPLRFNQRRVSEAREAIRKALADRFRDERPALVLVQGDTTSAVGGALAACDAGVPLGHVEAGLRSGTITEPWPEEGNRILIDRVSNLLFAPTALSAENLRRDPLVFGDIHVTGNSGIDALLKARGKVPTPFVPGKRKLIVATCHRRENRGERLERIAAAFKRIVRRLPVEIVLPLHLNSHVRRGVERHLGREKHIRLVEPLGYEATIALVEEAWALITDSGGLQEEAPALGTPVFVIRETTERPEAIDAGSAELVGTDPDRIVAAVTALFRDPARYELMSRPAFPFGDGHASGRIAALVAEFLRERGEPDLAERASS